MNDADRRHPGPETSLEAAVAELSARVAAIEHHLGLVAGGQAEAAAPNDPVEPVAPAAPIAAATADSRRAADAGLELPAVGISFLILAGAFLLRALTGAGTLGGTVGVTLGLAYVAFLILVTDRTARRGERTRALLYGLSTVLVAYPFVWETTTELGLLPARAAVAVKAVLATAGLAVALRHRLRALAWITLLAAVVTATGLYWTTPATEYFLALLIALGVATVWLGYTRGWTGPRWLLAAVVNFLVFLTVMMAAHPAQQAPGRPEPDPDLALLLAFALPLAYLGSFAWRTAVMRREADLFAILQSLGCVAAGYVGAIHLLHVTGRSTSAVGWLTLLAAVAAYVVAFQLVRARQGRGLNFFYFAWLGLLLMLVGSALVVAGRFLPFLWCGLGLATAIAGATYDRWTLRLHCAAYLVGAAVVTGLPGAAFAAFVAAAVPGWQAWSTVGVAVWAVVVACYALLVTTQRARQDRRWRRIPRFLTAALSLTGAGVLLVIGLVSWFSRTLAGPQDAVVAAVRTVVLAGSALALAALGRRPMLAELAWFTAPLLVITGLKVLWEDLRHGTPISLFVGFACFGAALILAPRLLRHGASRDSDISPEGDHVQEIP
jgi:hypothetical protein